MRKITSLTFLLFFGVLAPGWAQTIQPTPWPTEPLEKYEDAPRYIMRTGSSPRMISQFGGFMSYQVNIGPTGENIVGDAANEPSITMDPTNPSKMSIGWRQFDTVTNNFRRGGFAYTTDGGVSWTFPGSLSNVFRSDPVLFSTETGTFFYLSLISGLQDDIWRSLNGGQSWTRIAPATGGDKQWFTIDNNTNSSGHGFQYQFWTSGASSFDTRQFTRSIDGGLTWMDPINLPNTPAFGTLDVDSSGNLFLGGFNPNAQTFWCLRSSDAKNSKVVPTFDQVTQVDLGGVLDINRFINPVGIVGQSFLAIDHSGGSTNNNIYMVASVTFGNTVHASDVMFAKSTDGGQTFSAPRRINTNPANPNKWHWFGTMAVAPNGRIDVVWLDSRNAANDTDSQLFYSYSSDGGDTWSPDIAVSNPFNPFLGYPNQNKIGDYMTIVSDNGGGNVAYPATFNQEQDVYYVRVDPTLVPTPTPTPSPTPTATPVATTPPPPTATPTPTASATPGAASQAVNLSTRMRILTGDNVGIGGFIITGTGTKHVLIRAIGPSLSQFGVPNPLADPVLELHGTGAFVTINNDDWKDDPAQRPLIEATGLQPTNDFESAIEARLDPGQYTAVVTGKNNTTGVGLIEVYDLAAGDSSKLANISTRAFVSTGNDIVIAGFILGGNNSASDRVIIRGIGPSLASSGVTNPLANPILELRDSNGSLIFANNDWQENSDQASQLISAGLAPTNNLESGIAATLPPGLYTALLSGVNNGTGVGVVEIYDRGP
ncbi:MAG TPA: hypothetical protein VJU77_03080 [Chthoniobacterales bacterium]|nr:hypothetical protein [Chthoniobacterales bacterium]